MEGRETREEGVWNCGDWLEGVELGPVGLVLVGLSEERKREAFVALRLSDVL